MSSAPAFDMLIAIWSFCEPEDREAFVSYLAISGYIHGVEPKLYTPEQDGSAIVAVTSKAQLANAVGVEPLPSFISSPAITAGDDGHPSTPTIDARAAGQGESSHCMAQSIEAVTNLRERKRPSFRPHCQNPNLCRSGTRDHCHACKRAMAQSEAA